MASRYFKSGSTLWNSANSWSATSAAGADNAGIPTAADDVFFTSGSGATCAVTTTAGVCLTFTTTGYTGTITLNTTITVSGNITLGASTVLSGSSELICNASATLTSAGNSNINCPFTLRNVGTSNTYTLADNWTFNALFTTNATGGGLTHTINGNNIFCRGGISINGVSNSSTSLTTGTTVINITATGTITTSTNASGGLGNTFVINAPGSTITLANANIFYRTGTFRYVAGTISGTWNFNITGSCTLDMNNGGLNYSTPFSLVMQAASTITMSSDWYLSGIAVGFATTINGFSMYPSGTITITQPLNGTTVIRCRGSVGGQAVSSTTGIGNDITFQAGSNIVNITTLIVTPRSGGTSVTYTSGAVNHSGTLTVNGPNPITLNTSGMSWNNITFAGASFTITLNSLLTATGTISASTNNYTFIGTSGFTAGTLTWTSTPASTNTGIVLGAGLTYTVTSALTLYSATILTYLGVKSGTPGSVAYLTLRNGASQSVGNIQMTDIDASGGQTIYAWRPGAISNSSNIQALTPSLMQRSATYVN